MLCLGYPAEKLLIHGIPVGKHLHIIALERQGIAHSMKERYQLISPGKVTKSLLSLIFRHRTLAQARKTFLADEPFFARIASEEEIERQPHHWKEDKHQYPCHRLHRIPVVEQNNNDSKQDDSQIYQTEGKNCHYSPNSGFIHRNTILN